MTQAADKPARSRLSRFLEERFRGLLHKQIADRTGIAVPTVSRNLSGQKKPTLENMLRYAVALGIDVAQLHELAGDEELAALYRRLPSSAPPQVSERDLYDPQAAGLHERLQRLIALGEASQLDDALRGLEASWRRLEDAFTQTAQDANAKAAVLIGDSDSMKGQILFAWQCSLPRAAVLVQEGKLRGWRGYEHAAGDLTLTLFLQSPGSEADKLATTALAFWAPFIQAGSRG